MLICSEKTLWHSARRRASSWLAGSCPAVDVLTYPIRTGRSVRRVSAVVRVRPRWRL